MVEILIPKDSEPWLLCIYQVCLFTDPFTIKVKQRSTKKHPQDLLTAVYLLPCPCYGTATLMMVAVNYLW